MSEEATGQKRNKTIIVSVRVVWYCVAKVRLADCHIARNVMDSCVQPSEGYRVAHACRGREAVADFAHAICLQRPPRNNGSSVPLGSGRCCISRQKAVWPEANILAMLQLNAHATLRESGANSGLTSVELRAALDAAQNDLAALRKHRAEQMQQGALSI